MPGNVLLSGQCMSPYTCGEEHGLGFFLTLMPCRIHLKGRMLIAGATCCKLRQYFEQLGIMSEPDEVENVHLVMRRRDNELPVHYG